MEATFNSDLLETYTDFQISTHGKWKIDLFLNRIRLNFEISEQEPLSLSVWKF